MTLYTHSYASPLYNSWKDMRKRCYNPNRRDYQWYGGKGIRVCAEWLNSFEAFAVDMGPSWFQGATLNRRDGNGHYTKDNCNWITLADQQLNRGNVKEHWKHEEEVRALRAKGLTQEAIGLRLGMSQGSVSRILRGKSLKRHYAPKLS